MAIFKMIEMLAVFGGIIAFCLWQIHAVRKSREKAEAERAAARAVETTETKRAA